jgi:hypothetical protein
MTTFERMKRKVRVLHVWIRESYFKASISQTTYKITPTMKISPGRNNCQIYIYASKSKILGIEKTLIGVAIWGIQ